MVVGTLEEGDILDNLEVVIDISQVEAKFLVEVGSSLVSLVAAGTGLGGIARVEDRNIRGEVVIANLLT